MQVLSFELDCISCNFNLCFSLCNVFNS